MKTKKIDNWPNEFHFEKLPNRPAAPTVQQTVPAYSISSFPRDVTVGPDGSTLYVPNADAKVLQVITTSVK